MPEQNDSPMGHKSIRVVHSTPGGWDASQYHYATELQKEKPKGTGITAGMGDVKMNHQPSHTKPKTRGLDRLNPKRKAPETWNIDSGVNKPAEPPLTPDPSLEAELDKDLNKRNIKPRTRKPKTKDS